MFGAYNRKSRRSPTTRGSHEQQNNNARRFFSFIYSSHFVDAGLGVQKKTFSLKPTTSPAIKPPRIYSRTSVWPRPLMGVLAVRGYANNSRSHYASFCIRALPLPMWLIRKQWNSLCTEGVFYIFVGKEKKANRSAK